MNTDDLYFGAGVVHAEPGFLYNNHMQGLQIDRPLDPYFGGITAPAFEQGAWTGAADPRRDGRVGFAWRVVE